MSTIAEKKLQLYDGGIHHIACVQRWRLAAKCAVGAWLKCPLAPDRVNIRAEEKGYTTFQAEGGQIHLKRYNVGRTWDGALEMCRSDGATLVKIDTAEKQDIVGGLFKFKDHNNKKESWIGLRDTTRSNAYRWTDGSVPTYTNWYKGEPSFTYRGQDEDCVQILLLMFGSAWNDADCSKLRWFVCEM
ncbi:low affinity immunoglobulin epsilon Fc receptor-like [Haliotis rufescens]|uniref:low affinity immunoglobulin epsilon Fc receptor-like n=1 Tax=Haliotis rufescens TaxID=6454 RepID=UPI00201F7DDE|nr:low affinity immunoglobulin epsilon Fc receptor-like [Haliotis rufescens]